MSRRKVLFLAASECAPGREEEFTRWYHEVVVPKTQKAPGVVRVDRYRRIEDDPQYPTFLSVVEFEDEAAIDRAARSEPFQAASQEVFKNGPGFGMQVKWLVHYKRIGP